ncbi:MAG: hypothetical protein ACREF4_22535, partial [Gammaproteobacteria bacterium]
MLPLIEHRQRAVVSLARRPAAVSPAASGGRIRRSTQEATAAALSVILSWRFMQRVFVAPTGRTGKGLFANVPFAAGQTILVIKGTVTTSAYNAHYRVGPRWIGIGDCAWLV